MATKQAKKQPGGSWAVGAFPEEAAKNYDEVDVAVVVKLKAELEKDISEEKWEVVDGFSFPYDKIA